MDYFCVGFSGKGFRYLLSFYSHLLASASRAIVLVKFWGNRMSLTSTRSTLMPHSPVAVNDYKTCYLLPLTFVKHLLCLQSDAFPLAHNLRQSSCTQDVT